MSMLTTTSSLESTRLSPSRTEAFKRDGTHRDTMSQATKIVLGTIGISAVLGLAILFGLAFV
ncbi:hypothetical protein HSB1_20950 [Halogranum salarium B-1]|uniref:Uncharacterized protein n=1 Tax=Halogranum salarium B-1 TaxID=1210908 RepID=J3EXP6_9EURY|nr:hypothetical protein HSB1_20950 [Halogranum salarium B-1]